MSCISDKFFKLTKYAVLCCACGSYNIVLLCHIYTYIHIRSNTHIHTRARAHTHTHTQRERHTHSHTHSHRFKFCDFLERLRNQIHVQLRQYWSAKFKFFNENIRSNMDSGQTERRKLKYLHYLNKMIEKCKMRKFIFSEVSCF